MSFYLRLLSSKSSFYLVTSFRHVFSSPSTKIFQFIRSPFLLLHLSSLYLLQNVSRLEVVCMISLELFARLNPLLQPKSLIPLDSFFFLCRAAFLILFFICFFVFFLKGIKKSMEYFLLIVKK